MPVALAVTINRAELAALAAGPMRGAVKRALGKAGATALRDMRSEASKRVRSRKRIKASYVREAITMRRVGGPISRLEWSLDVSGDPVPLVAYPHRETERGVSVEVNRGKRTVIEGAFEARMRSGHEGIFKRRGPARLPIDELLGSRPLDALLHPGESEAVAERGGRSFGETFARVLPLELAKGSK